jgi:hypothetical protein
VTKLQAAVTAVDAGILWSVGQNAAPRTAFCLEMDEGIF